MTTFIAKCPACKKEYEADVAWIGQTGKCPTCDSEITVNKQHAISTTATNASPDVWKAQKKGWNKIAFISICLFAIIITNIFTFIYFTRNKNLPKTETGDAHEIRHNSKPAPIINKSKAAEAREKLGFMNIPFDEETLIKHIEKNDLHVVELFINAGFNPNIIPSTGRNGDLSALMIAAKIGENSIPMIDLLLKAGAELNGKIRYGEYEGFTAYQFALGFGNEATPESEYLASKGANKNIEALISCECRSNLKQIGLAMSMYAIENNDNFPSQDGAEGLEKLRSSGYLENKRVYLCPAHEMLRQKEERTSTDDNAPLNNKTVDYIYFGGFKNGDKDGDRLPIAFDRPSNHKDGVNVLFDDRGTEKIKGDFKSCADIVNFLKKDLSPKINDKLMSKAKAQDLILQRNRE